MYYINDVYLRIGSKWNPRIVMWKKHTAINSLLSFLTTGTILFAIMMGIMLSSELGMIDIIYWMIIGGGISLWLLIEILLRLDIKKYTCTAGLYGDVVELIDNKTGDIINLTISELLNSNSQVMSYCGYFEDWKNTQLVKSNARVRINKQDVNKSICMYNMSNELYNYIRNVCHYNLIYHHRTMSDDD